MYIGYARVSTHDQNLDLQKAALKKVVCKKIFVDEISGSIRERPGLDKADDAATSRYRSSRVTEFKQMI